MTLQITSTWNIKRQITTYIFAISGYHSEVVTEVTVFCTLHERNDNSKGTAQIEFLF